MKIKRVCIENFCCLRTLDVSFDAITSLIGPTGVGKSTVMRALDWFFNGDKGGGIEEGDVHSAAEGKRVRVEVEFDGLTVSDRTALGYYAPDGVETVRIWRTWEDGDDRITGKALAYAPFDEIRRHEGKRERLNAYKALRESDPELDLPAARGWDDAEAAMLVWESKNRDRLQETDVESTQFFGFAGQGLLAKLIDFVFISADLRAYEETDDSKATAVGRILEHAVDRSEADARFTSIDDAAQTAREKVHEEVYGPMLKRLSGSLSDEVAKFSTGRNIVVKPVAQTPKPAKTTFAVSIKDGAATTSVRRQGHGFQRALIIAALKYLAETRRPEDGTRSLCLAIEEPELFQHPAQTRVFAQVLRGLVSSAADRTQVMYATHSPVFIDPRNYAQIRRLVRVGSGKHPEVTVRQLSEQDLIQSLVGRVSDKSIRRHATTRYVKDLAEGLFVAAAVLVEGEADEAVILGFADQQGLSFGANGISVINVEGKDNLILAHAILSGFGVKCHVVFDGDAGPKALAGKAEAVRTAGEKNMNILGYLGASTTARPATACEATHTVFEDDLETYLAEHWPAWTERRKELAKQGDGYLADCKHAPTYAEAARTAGGEPKLLYSLLENVMALASY
ncbi:ATP-dependent nuclease [Streptomyces californicus]|uniref:ATP-dependent nuclease n=1 Tax=Streptomyces californicus TaxID=67351 RepID=UPI001E3879A5|nr:AAA family ATPase [Streptomyces californicus]MCC0578417.1 ATP-dependent endonuclease [Streptomyces californicus]